MSFSFGFEDDDDIETSPPTAHSESTISQSTQEATAQIPQAAAPQTHKIEDLLSTLPSRLAFSWLPITSPAGRKIFLPRRELFDIKMQLMAEDSLSSSPPTSKDRSNTRANAGTDDNTPFDTTSDINTHIYEGGFKTWECSVDLCRFLLDRGPRKDLDDLHRVNHILELGCGTALPSLLLFRYIIENSLEGVYLTLTDYNASVLRLATVPNLLLTWTSTLPATAAPFSTEHPNPLSLPPQCQIETQDSPPQAGDLPLTPELLTAFLTALTSLHLTPTLLSGSWSPLPPFQRLLPTSPDLNTLLLSAETIYSPATLRSFAAALTAALRSVKMGKALVAAKKLYFGVGGGVDEFKRVCAEMGAVAWEIEGEFSDEGGAGTGQAQGVRRCLVEVQMY